MLQLSENQSASPSVRINLEIKFDEVSYIEYSNSEENYTVAEPSNAKKMKLA